MATNAQSFIQPLAQGNSPFTVNNGNPNTVYNQKPTGMVNFIPQTGAYLAPQSDAMNNWAVNPVPMGGVTTPFWQLPSGGGQPQGPRLTVPPLTIDPSWVPTTPPTTTPPTTTPPVTPPTGTPSGGGGGGGNLPNYGVGPSLVGTSGSNYTHTVGGGGGGSLSNIVNSVGGNFQWQELLDAFLPGDLYDAESGTWDITNSVAEALNYVIPGLGDAAQFAANNGLLGQTIQDLAFNESYRQFEARQRNNVNEAVGNAMNTMDQRVVDTMASRLAARQNAFNPGGAGWSPSFNTGYGVGQISPITGQPTGLGSSPFDGSGNSSGSTINDRMNNWGVGGAASGGRDSRSGHSAGSGTVATGQAAIDIASGLRDASNAAMFSAIQQQMRDMIKIQ